VREDCGKISLKTYKELHLIYNQKRDKYHFDTFDAVFPSALLYDRVVLIVLK